jgi:hypothetical protein
MYRCRRSAHPSGGFSSSPAAPRSSSSIALCRSPWGGRISHLHEFIVNGRRYGAPDPDYDEVGEVVAETGVCLERVSPVPGASILYLYDFGDFWQHDVRLEATLPAEPGITYPRLLGGARSCPPEDCGGARGYAGLLEILLDPEHEDFEHMRAWVGPRLNAEVFSAAAVNQRLLKRTFSPLNLAGFI